MIYCDATKISNKILYMISCVNAKNLNMWINRDSISSSLGIALACA